MVLLILTVVLSENRLSQVLMKRVFESKRYEFGFELRLRELELNKFMVTLASILTRDDWVS